MDRMVRGGLSFGEHMIENACMGASSTCRPEQAKRHTVTEAVLAHDVFKSAFSRQWQCENKKICFSPHTLPRRLGELTATFGSAGISAVYNSVQTHNGLVWSTSSSYIKTLEVPFCSLRELLHGPKGFSKVFLRWLFLS